MRVQGDQGFEGCYDSHGCLTLAKDIGAVLRPSIMASLAMSARIFVVLARARAESVVLACARVEQQPPHPAVNSLASQ
jgi:hypothetical protein